MGENLDQTLRFNVVCWNLMAYDFKVHVKYLRGIKTLLIVYHVWYKNMLLKNAVSQDIVESDATEPVCVSSGQTDASSKVATSSQSEIVEPRRSTAETFHGLWAVIFQTECDFVYVIYLLTVK